MNLKKNIQSIWITIKKIGYDFKIKWGIVNYPKFNNRGVSSEVRKIL